MGSLIVCSFFIVWFVKCYVSDGGCCEEANGAFDVVLVIYCVESHDFGC